MAEVDSTNNCIAAREVPSFPQPANPRSGNEIAKMETISQAARRWDFLHAPRPAGISKTT